MNIAIDTHTHTIVSGHAYSTIREMTTKAAEYGLEGLAITEHAPAMPGGCHEFYFQNLHIVPKHMNGIRLLLGSEVNIMNELGEIDLPDSLLGRLDVVVASMHTPCYGESKGIDKNTEAYLNVMQNPNIHIIGHPDDGRFPIHYEPIVLEAKKRGILLEVNNSSLRPGGFRRDADTNIKAMLTLCKKHEAYITLSSDAHVDEDVAGLNYAKDIVKACDFPENLIANASIKALKEFIDF